MTTIWLPKKELVIATCAKARVQGFYKLTAIRPDGRERPLTGWFPNLVTDVGLNRIGQGSYMTACHVGTNNTAPNVLDTSLAGFVAGTTTRQAESSGAQATEPYYGWKRVTYRFATGAAAGNIAEVGIASTALVSGVLFSRALVLDELAAPTTVTVLSDEVLDVTYELRLYPPLTDTLGTITITGSGDHDYTARAANVTSGSSWGNYLGARASLEPVSGSLSFALYNGVIGAITGGPSGSASNASPSDAAYSSNSLYRDGTASWGLNSGNLSGGIQSIAFTTTLGRFQYQLDPVIAKDNTKTLSITNRVSWDRYTP